MRVHAGVCSILVLGAALAACTATEVEPLVGGSGGATALGTQPDLIPRAKLFGNPDRAALRVSHDGKHLAFLAPVNGIMNVWVGPIDDLNAAKPVTNDSGRGIRQFNWPYTPDRLIYLQDRGGDENWKILMVDLASGQETDLTPFEEINGPDGKPIMLPGGKKMRPAAQIVGLSSSHPDEMLIGLNNRDPQWHDVHRVNLKTGERKLVLKNEGFAGFVADDEFAIRLAVKPTEDGGQEVMKATAQPGADGTGAKFESLMVIPGSDALTSGPMGFDHSGKTLYYRDSRGRNTGALMAMNMDTGAATLVAEDAHADAGGIMENPADGTVQAVSFNYLRNEWKVLDKSIQGDLDYLKTVTDGDVQVLSRSLDDHWWTVQYIVDNGPARVYLYERPAHKATFAFSTRSALDNTPMARMFPVVIKSSDGLDLVSYLTLPLGSNPDGSMRPRRPVPMVLMVHGGPWARDEWGFNGTAQWMANRGYAVLQVNFRGSTGFGKNFTNAGNKEWAGKMHEDLIDAVNWAIREKIADHTKIAIYGGSYGGYSALVGVTFTPKVFACSVDIVGPSNIVTLLNTIPPYWKPMIKVFAERVGDHQTEEGKKFLAARSPITYVDRIERPLLIGQGANDPRVKQAEADQIVQAMQARKIPVTYVLYPDEGHGFARPPNRTSFNAITEAFLSKHLGGRCEPIGDDFAGSSVTVPVGAEFIPGMPATGSGGGGGGGSQAMGPVPATPKRPVSDEYHGVKVTDDYRWLEESSNPAVKAWSDAQNVLARKHLDALPGRDRIKARLNDLIAAPIGSYSNVTFRGGRIFAIRNQPPKQQPVIVTMASATAEASTAKVVLDPEVLDPTGGTAIDFYVPSPDGKLVAVSLSQHGSESGSVAVFEVDTGKRTSDDVPRVNGGTAGGDVAWTADSSGFFYTRYPRSDDTPARAPVDMDFFQQVYFHKLGTPTTQDSYETGREFPRIAEVSFSQSTDRAVTIANVANGDGGEFAHYIRTGPGQWHQITRFNDRVVQAVVGADHAVWLLSRAGAPRGKVLRLAPGKQDLSEAQEVVPQGAGAIQTVALTDSRLLAVEQAGGPMALKVYDLAGKPQKPAELPAIATIEQVVTLSGDEALIALETCTTPPAYWRFDAVKGTQEPTHIRSNHPADYSNVEVVREVATSKDGTKVPMTIMRRKGTPLNGKNPTILWGYGGYGISESPTFSPSRLFWLENGGVYVIANIRGGGEFGDEWHTAGNLTNKQNVFDDFAACGKRLIELGYTSSDHLGLFGGSNGGLLMGATLVQNPRLAKAIVSSVGIYDMLRVETTPNGAFNVTEFGTVKDPAHFRALAAYSPYHNVKEGVKYPPTLFMTGENDPRVDPWHSRKFVARLQAASPNGGPFLLRTSSDTGHGMGSPLRAVVEERTDLYAFFTHHLGLNMK